MNHKISVKEELLEHLISLLNNKIDELKITIISAKESRNSDTKSSAGDKHETGRAMMQIELEKSEVQLDKTITLKNQLSRINVAKVCNTVEFGSLVSTNQGNYFFSIGIGKIEVNNETYYAISLASPIGLLLQGKIVGDKAQFQEKEFIISDIV